MNGMYMAMATRIWVDDARRIFLCFTAGRGYHLDWYEAELQVASRNTDLKTLDRHCMLNGDLGMKLNPDADKAIRQAWPQFRLKTNGKPISG